MEIINIVFRFLMVNIGKIGPNHAITFVVIYMMSIAQITQTIIHVFLTTSDNEFLNLLQKLFPVGNTMFSLSVS